MLRKRKVGLCPHFFPSLPFLGPSFLVSSFLPSFLVSSFLPFFHLWLIQHPQEHHTLGPVLNPGNRDSELMELTFLVTVTEDTQANQQTQPLTSQTTLAMLLRQTGFCPRRFSSCV